jgi:hypothetical protein
MSIATAQIPHSPPPVSPSRNLSNKRQCLGTVTTSIMPDTQVQQIINPLSKAVAQIPLTIEECASREAVLHNVACYLDQISASGSKVLSEQNDLTYFHSADIPKISIYDYISRIVNYANMSTESVVQALGVIYYLYINNIKGRSSFTVVKHTVHRLILTALVVSAKVFDDLHINNERFAHLGGISLKELNRLEIEYLILINFELRMDVSTYEIFYTSLARSEIHKNCTHAVLPLLVIDSECSKN